ncbi:MAG TPA: hypothetical protein VKE70_19425 [Candidatus Solibacter sp.]|nr:hypothetical protein [Candidatus Solibacter sp.]
MRSAFLAAASLALSAQSFEDYPAPDRYRGKPAAPQFDTTRRPDF